MSIRAYSETVKKASIAATTALVALLALAGFAPAGAHAAYKYSSPDDESTVEEPPTEIWAEYTEPPTDASYMKVYDPCGLQVDNADSRAEAARNRVYITMSSDRAGTYQVDWFVDSAVDAHSTRGTFTFTVTDGEPCPGHEPEREEAASDGRAESGGAGGGRTDENSGSSDLAAERVDPADEAQRRGGDRVAENDRARARQSGRDVGRRRDSPRVAAPEDGELKPEEPGIFEGIPAGGLVLGFTMAALIGAAGGLIYAGIMGYNRG
jgi:methionine-rich copper-binding protein CopC